MSNKEQINDFRRFFRWQPMKNAITGFAAVTMSSVLLSGCVSTSYDSDNRPAVDASDIVGEYKSDSAAGGESRLIIRQLSPTSFHIATKPDGDVGCTFSSESDLTGSEVHIALSNVNKKLSGVMTIIFDGRSAVIDTLTPDSRVHLESFCKGGSSLYGSYSKKR